jgi:hypothetical protein
MINLLSSLWSVEGWWRVVEGWWEICKNIFSLKSYFLIFLYIDLLKYGISCGLISEAKIFLRIGKLLSELNLFIKLLTVLNN